jgi:hypothetical protein
LILRVPCLYGWAGVDLFFVLSGYLIGGQVFKAGSRMDGGGIVRFWLRRWFRTLPLYYFILFVNVIILPQCGIPFRDWNWRYLVMLQNYMPLQDFQQSWSLCIEEQFYLVFPILALIAGRLRLKPWVWLVPALVSLVLRYALVDPAANRVTAQYTIRFPIYTHMDGLSVGVFLAATRPVWCEFSQRPGVAATSFGRRSRISRLLYLDRDRFRRFSGCGSGHGAFAGCAQADRKGRSMVIWCVSMEQHRVFGIAPAPPAVAAELRRIRAGAGPGRDNVCPDRGAFPQDSQVCAFRPGVQAGPPTGELGS